MDDQRDGRITHCAKGYNELYFRPTEVGMPIGFSFQLLNVLEM